MDVQLFGYVVVWGREGEDIPVNAMFLSSQNEEM